MLVAERLGIVEKESPHDNLSHSTPAHQIYPLSHRDGGYIFMCRGEMRTAAVVRSKSRAETITRGSMSNVGVRIIKFHNTIFSDIEICLLAEA